jgi:tRNA G18 (ribose-2'-O)-methylase SpoU
VFGVRQDGKTLSGHTKWSDIKARRGFFAIGICDGKIPENLGTLWRSAHLYRSAFVFTVGTRYGQRQASDTMHTTDHIPLFHFHNIEDLVDHLPKGCSLIGIEQEEMTTSLHYFAHPIRAAYLLGSETCGLSPEVRQCCDEIVKIDSPLPYSMNVAVAGSIVMYDRYVSNRVR